jgi:hypothetical protein
MKIIGKTKDGFILEASKDDVAGMEGLYSHEKHFEVGDMIDIYGLFSKYSAVNSAFNDIERLRSSVNRIIDASNWVAEFRVK